MMELVNNIAMLYFIFFLLALSVLSKYIFLALIGALITWLVINRSAFVPLTHMVVFIAEVEESYGGYVCTFGSAYRNKRSELAAISRNFPGQDVIVLWSTTVESSQIAKHFEDWAVAQKDITSGQRWFSTDSVSTLVDRARRLKL
jgi:hypothetical protein